MIVRVDMGVTLGWTFGGLPPYLGAVQVSLWIFPLLGVALGGFFSPGNKSWGANIDKMDRVDNGETKGGQRVTVRVIGEGIPGRTPSFVKGMR